MYGLQTVAQNKELETMDPDGQGQEPVHQRHSAC